MPQEESKNIDGKDDVGVDDIIGQEMVKDQLENLEKEKKQFTEVVEDGKKTLERMEEQWKVDVEIYEIQQEGFHGGENPTMAFEANPRYWELMKQKHAWKFEQEKARYEGWVKQKKKEIDMAQEQVDSADKKIKELTEVDSNE